MAEINNEHYCAGDFFGGTEWCNMANRQCVGILCGTVASRIAHCPCYHRKHPTPEQFKEEYGHEYPDDGAVYFYRGVYDFYKGMQLQTATYSWEIMSYEKAIHFRKSYPMLVIAIVCACTPWGKPADNWSPE
jgi:hypothetical protein